MKGEEYLVKRGTRYASLDTRYDTIMMEIEKLKKWVKEIVNASPYSTDERVAAVQVVDFTEKTMQIRILGKGPDAPTTWNLRCEIREKLIEKFQKDGMALPQIRINTDAMQLISSMPTKQ